VEASLKAINVGSSVSVNGSRHAVYDKTAGCLVLKTEGDEPVK
jgi:hypothetical protein